MQYGNSWIPNNHCNIIPHVNCHMKMTVINIAGIHGDSKITKWQIHSHKLWPEEQVIRERLQLL